MSKHTPGPWECRDGDDYAVISGDEFNLGHLFHVRSDEGDGHDAGQSEANARLIVAAPEMLDVLKLIAGSSLADTAEWGYLITVAVNVIAKAEGT